MRLPGITKSTGFRVFIGSLALVIAIPAAQAQETTAKRDSIRDTAQVDGYRAMERSSDQDSAAQNPPGYRGMERPVNVFPPDTALADSSASADATSRIDQMQRQDPAESRNQNPPGYRGMERPAALDSASSDTAKAASATSADTTKTGAKANVKQKQGAENQKPKGNDSTSSQ